MAPSNEASQDLGARRPVPPTMGDTEQLAHIPEREAHSDLMSIMMCEQVQRSGTFRSLPDPDGQVEHDLLIQLLNGEPYEKQIILPGPIADLDRDRLRSIQIGWMRVLEHENVGNTRRGHDGPFSSFRGVLTTRLCCR